MFSVKTAFNLNPISQCLRALLQAGINFEKISPKFIEGNYCTYKQEDSNVIRLFVLKLKFSHYHLTLLLSLIKTGKKRRNLLPIFNQPFTSSVRQKQMHKGGGGQGGQIVYPLQCFWKKCNLNDSLLTPRWPLIDPPNNLNFNTHLLFSTTVHPWMVKVCKEFISNFLENRESELNSIILCLSQSPSPESLKLLCCIL